VKIDTHGYIHDHEGKYAGAIFGAAGFDVAGREDIGAFIGERAAALEGYAPAITRAGIVDARSTGRREDWWDTLRAQAEYNRAGGDFPKMPDDNTPSMSDGAALSGARRTHRSKFNVGGKRVDGKRDWEGGLTIRMPSKASLNRFADETGGTFDVPVSATLNGKTVQGWVRVTKHGPSSWTVSPVGFDGKAGDLIAETVNSNLEKRRVAPYPTDVNDILARRQSRRAAMGTGYTRDVKSTFLTAVGYDEHTGTLVVGMKTGTYEYKNATYRDFRRIIDAESPGSAYNQYVKGRLPSERTDAQRCPKCGRFMPVDGPHECAFHKHPPVDEPEYNRMATAHLANLASWFKTREVGEGKDTLGIRPQRVSNDGSIVPVKPKDDVAPPSANPVPVAPAFGSHVAPGPGARRIDLAEVLSRMDADGERGAQPGIYGPAGFTVALAPILDKHTSSHYTPKSYTVKMFGKPGEVRPNGHSGEVGYTGVGADQARDMLKALPPANLDDRQGEAPRVGAILASVTANPGKVECGGYIVGSNSTNERASVDEVLIYDDTLPENAGMAWRAIQEKYSLDDAEAMPSMRRIQVPWRPGETAWTLWWR